MTGQEIERTAVPEQSLAPGLLNERELRSLDAVAKRAANTGLVPKALQGKPDDVLLVMVTGREMGFRGPMAALSHLYPIEGRIAPSAQTMTGLAERAGHEVWVEERTSEKCVAAGCRRGSKRVQRVTYTLADARRAGLLDRWVEKWQQTQGGKRYCEKHVIGNDLGFDDEKISKLPPWAKKAVGDGEIKTKENWAKYPAEMCQARALSALCRMAFSDALLGLEPMTPEELGEDVDLDLEPDTHTESVRPAGYDDEPVDAELLDVQPDETDAPDPDEIVVDPDADENSGGGDSEEAPPSAPPNEAPAGEPSEEKENAYARAVHILAHELGLKDEQVDEILYETVGEVSANAVTRENYGPVIERMREAAGKAA